MRAPTRTDLPGGSAARRTATTSSSTSSREIQRTGQERRDVSAESPGRPAPPRGARRRIRHRRDARPVAALRAWQPSTGTATALIVVATCTYGLVAFFARRLGDLGMAPVGVALYRYLLTAAVTVRFVRVDRRARRATAWAFGSGVAMGLGYITYTAAVAVVDVATVSLVYMTYPLFAIAGARLLFGVEPTRRAIGGGLLIVVATALALDPGAVGGDAGLVLLAFLAPLTFGTSIAVLTERLGELDPVERIGAVTLGAVTVLVPLSLVDGVAHVVPSSPEALLLVVGIGLVTSLVPMTLYAIAAPRVGAARSSVAGAVELPVLFAIGAIAFGESLHWSQLGAGVLVVVAIVITPARSVPAAAGRPRRPALSSRRRRHPQ